MEISEGRARSGTKRQYMKMNHRVRVNHLPASNDWSISRKGFVLFFAITFVSSLFSLLQLWPVDLLLWWCFLSFCLPSFLFPHFLPLLSSFLQIRLPPSEDWLADRSDNHRVCGSGKAVLSHFLLFCSKWAGGAYLSRTEILVVRRRGVAAIASFTVISFRLINSKLCHFCSNSC